MNKQESYGENNNENEICDSSKKLEERLSKYDNIVKPVVNMWHVLIDASDAITNGNIEKGTAGIESVVKGLDEHIDDIFGWVQVVMEMRFPDEDPKVINEIVEEAKKSVKIENVNDNQ